MTSKGWVVESHTRNQRGCGSKSRLPQTCGSRCTSWKSCCPGLFSASRQHRGNNAYLYTVHADLFNHKGSAQSTVSASRPVGEASVLTHLLRRQNRRATGVMKVKTVSNILLVQLWQHFSATVVCTTITTFVVVAAVVATSRIVCAVGLCSSSAQCKDDEASKKNGLAPWKFPTPLS